ncbi:PepSY domain-containing protein [Fervidibacillus halotolerans]|uniref:PepSY domain-containing protein n=1 Tax=Fervidibacillus halotolerans TaxID=2980027 RepID=A0A9E8LYH9_9BACI|nr:PepSY domain-containing protein [Fervidibacillus halotolerans]WAA11752.1 PepSY domain-containing protein [Fervidibacillus halotolerans]
MKWKDFFTGFTIGAAIGVFTKTYRKKIHRSEEILNLIKNEMNPYGKIVGSWILAQPERMQSGEGTTLVYKGGITQIREGERKYMDFIVDAYTGEILHFE